jgi:hypothetical protein
VRIGPSYTNGRRVGSAADLALSSVGLYGADRVVMGAVISVGSRALVAPLVGTSAGTLTDENGIATGRTLAADVEVEIVAWRPRGRNSNRYRVRSVADGVEGWIDGSMIREQPRPVIPRRPMKLPSGPTPRGLSARPRRGGGGGR